MKINVNDNNRETVHTIIAATLIVSGMLAFSWISAPWATKER